MGCRRGSPGEPTGGPHLRTDHRPSGSGCRARQPGSPSPAVPARPARPAGQDLRDLRRFALLALSQNDPADGREPDRLRLRRMGLPAHPQGRLLLDDHHAGPAARRARRAPRRRSGRPVRAARGHAGLHSLREPSVQACGCEKGLRNPAGKCNTAGSQGCEPSSLCAATYLDRDETWVRVCTFFAEPVVSEAPTTPTAPFLPSPPATPARPASRWSPRRAGICSDCARRDRQQPFSEAQRLPGFRGRRHGPRTCVPDDGILTKPSSLRPAQPTAAPPASRVSTKARCALSGLALIPDASASRPKVVPQLICRIIRVALSEPRDILLP